MNRPALKIAVPTDHLADARRVIATRALAGHGQLARKIRANRARAEDHPLRALLFPWSV